jgi:regulation of enolase protein 1 (concanavalin A-like superfamily)
MNPVTLTPIPTPLQWEIPPLEWNVKQGDSLTIVAGKSTSLFCDPRGTRAVDNAPRLMFRPQGDFLLSAGVAVDFQNTFDASVLLVYDSEDLWAKLCFELSPQQKPTIVSVVNRGLSDDCNSMPVNGNQIYLRVARLDHAFAFHSSTDGRSWYLIRYFTLGEIPNARVGFLAQSPYGGSCRVLFSEIAFAQQTLDDIRSGE